MAAFALVGVLDYTDDVAMASTGGIACASTDPCTLRVPSEGRVLSMASGGPVRGFSIEGGPLHVVCPPGSSPVDQDSVSGSVSVRGCSVGLCRHLSGSLTVDWDGAVECTDFEGTVTSLGSSTATIRGAGILNSGGTGVTTVAGGEWRIRGSGPVNFTGADDFECDSGTAGITPTDWGWLRRDTVTLSEFAVSVPVTKFEDQTINVLGGWPDGSTLRGCVASGSFGHVPLIVGSEVSVSDHAFGPVVERIERSLVRGNIRSESASSLILLNEVQGSISVATQTTFVNAAPPHTGGSDALTITGPHCVLCPDCGWTEFYDGSAPTATTDLYIAAPSEPISLNLAGHHAILDLSPPDGGRTGKGAMPNRSRRGFSTTGNVTSLDFTGGTVTLTNQATIESGQAYTFTDCTFEFGDYRITMVAGSSVELRGSTVVGASSANDTDIKAYFYQYGTSNQLTTVTLDGCNVTGFVSIDVSDVTITDTSAQYVGSIVTHNLIDPSLWCVCSLRLWDGTSSAFVTNLGNNASATTIDNQCDSICVYSGSEPTNCDGPNQLDLAAGDTACPTTTTTTPTTTTPPTTTTTVYSPPGASDSSSSDDLAIEIIAGIAAGSILALSIVSIYLACAKGDDGYSVIDGKDSN